MSWYPLRYYSYSPGPEPPGPTPPTPEENYVTEIQIKRMPQQYYPNNRQIDLGDIRVDAIYNNGFSTDVTSECGFIPADSSLIQSSDTVSLNTSYICTDGTFYATEVPLYAIDQTSYNFAYNVSNNVTSCYNLFNTCTSFDKPVTIGSNVTNCASMFQYCENFNQPITIPENTTNCFAMFYSCINFNQPITIPSNVTNCVSMFSSCINLNNQTIDIPDNVTNVSKMFENCAGKLNIKYNLNVTDTYYENMVAPAYGYLPTKRKNVNFTGGPYSLEDSNLILSRATCMPIENFQLDELNQCYYEIGNNLYIYGLNCTRLKTLTGITLTGTPEYYYLAGKPFDASNITLTASFSDGTTSSLNYDDAGVTIYPRHADLVPSTTTTTTSTVSYTYGGVTKSVSDTLYTYTNDTFDHSFNFTNISVGIFDRYFENCRNLNGRIKVLGDGEISIPNMFRYCTNFKTTIDFYPNVIDTYNAFSYANIWDVAFHQKATLSSNTFYHTNFVTGTPSRPGNIYIYNLEFISENIFDSCTGSVGMNIQTCNCPGMHQIINSCPSLNLNISFLGGMTKSFSFSELINSTSIRSLNIYVNNSTNQVQYAQMINNAQGNFDLNIGPYGNVQDLYQTFINSSGNFKLHMNANMDSSFVETFCNCSGNADIIINKKYDMGMPLISNSPSLNSNITILNKSSGQLAFVSNSKSPSNIYLYCTGSQTVDLAFSIREPSETYTQINIWCKNISNISGLEMIYEGLSQPIMFDSMVNGQFNSAYNIFVYNNLI